MKKNTYAFEFIQKYKAEAYAEINWVVRENGDCILHVAAECNQFEIWDWIVQNVYYLYIDSTNQADETSLMVACREGRLDFVQKLCAKYADLKVELSVDRLNVDI